MSKKNLLPAIVLTVICIVVALLLSLTNMLTKGIIEEQMRAKINESLKTVAIDPDNCDFEDVTSDYTNLPDTVKNVYLDGVNGSYAVLVKRQGYASVISMTVGLKDDGTVIKVVITDQQESHGNPNVSKLPERFEGVNADTIDDVELISGATITSKAIKTGVEDALVALGVKEEAPDIPRTEDELINLSMSLLPGATGFTNVTPEDNEGLVKRIFKDNGGKGYVVYTHTYAQYGGGLETETLIAFDNDGKVVGVNKLHWVVGHTVEQGAPTDDVVNAFFQGFVGKKADAFEGVEAATGATGTCNNVKSAFTEASEAVLALINDIPRTNDELINLSMSLLPGATGFTNVTPEDNEGLVKRIFKDNGGKGFTVYTHTYAQYGGGLETETLIAFDNEGKVVGVNKLHWVVGHTVEQGAPTDDVVNAFFQGFVGKKADAFEGVEAATGATGTCNNVKSAFTEASEAVLALINDIPRTNDELINLSMSLLPGATGFTNVTPEDNEGLVKRIFKDNGGKGYVVYTHTYAQFGGGLETETLIAFDNDGKVVGVKKLHWVVGHTVDQGAPTDDVVNAFFQGFVGKKADAFEGVEAATGATGTCNNVKSAFAEASETVLSLINDAPSVEDESPAVDNTAKIVGIISIALILGGIVAVVVISKKRRVTK